MADVTPEPCRACPWRTENQGKRTPGGWYSKRNLSQLWAGLRRGEQMSCHPTDPRMVNVEGQGYEGFRAAPAHAEVKECVGALILVQREVMAMQEYPSYGDYRRARPRGLMREGLASIVERALFGGTVLGGASLPKPNLAHPDVDLPFLERWRPHRG